MAPLTPYQKDQIRITLSIGILTIIIAGYAVLAYFSLLSKTPYQVFAILAAFFLAGYLFIMALAFSNNYGDPYPSMLTLADIFYFMATTYVFILIVVTITAQLTDPIRKILPNLLGYNLFDLLIIISVFLIIIKLQIPPEMLTKIQNRLKRKRQLPHWAKEQ